MNAVTRAESTTAADTITLAARCTYVIGGPNNSDFGGNGLPVVRTPITIVANGATITRVGEDRFRFFYVDAPGRLSLRNLTLSGGQPSAGTPGWAGGAVFVQTGATVDLQGSTISGNAAGEGVPGTGYPGGAGGGIYNAGQLTLTRSTVSGNSSGRGGAGFDAGPVADGPGNEGGPGGPGGNGGGIYNAGVLSVSGGSVTSNHAERGGQGGSGGLVESTGMRGLDGARGTDGTGGGIFNFAQMSLARLTFSANTPNDCTGSGCPSG